MFFHTYHPEIFFTVYQIIIAYPQYSNQSRCKNIREIFRKNFALSASDSFFFVIGSFTLIILKYFSQCIKSLLPILSIAINADAKTNMDCSTTRGCLSNINFKNAFTVCCSVAKANKLLQLAYAVHL